jgi:hypothetical protein
VRVDAENCVILGFRDGTKVKDTEAAGHVVSMRSE